MASSTQPRRSPGFVDLQQEAHGPGELAPLEQLATPGEEPGRLRVALVPGGLGARVVGQGPLLIGGDPLRAGLHAEARRDRREQERPRRQPREALAPPALPGEPRVGLGALLGPLALPGAPLAPLEDLARQPVVPDLEVPAALVRLGVEDRRALERCQDGREVGLRDHPRQLRLGAQRAAPVGGDEVILEQPLGSGPARSERLQRGLEVAAQDGLGLDLARFPSRGPLLEERAAHDLRVGRLRLRGVSLGLPRHAHLEHEAAHRAGVPRLRRIPARAAWHTAVVISATVSGPTRKPWSRTRRWSRRPSRKRPR